MKKYIFVFVLLALSSAVSADPVARDTVTRYYSISPAAFGAMRYDYAWQRHVYGLWALQSSLAMDAAVYLPDSAEILEFSAWVTDNHPTNFITVLLRYTLLNGSGGANIATLVSTPNGGLQELIDSTISNNIVDNDNSMYSVSVIFDTPDSSHILRGVKIKYRISASGQAVEEHFTPDAGTSAIENIYPAPFSRHATIEYTVVQRAPVSVVIYDETGRLVRVLVDEIKPQGHYTAQWDGVDMNGSKVAAGSYFCRVQTNGSSAMKMIHVE